MAVSTPEPEGAELPHPSGAGAAVAAAAGPEANRHCILAAGGRWHNYEIEGPAPGQLICAYEATEVTMREKVLIAVEPLTNDTERRRAVWEKLCRRIPAKAGILGCAKSIDEDGWHYEVMIRPPAMTLREWIECNKADEWTRKHFLQQFVVALEALHAEGIVHLNIRPETIYLEDRDGRMGIVLGGLDVAMLYNHPMINPAKIDPFYTPPESVDPGGLPSGSGLRAWDWWCVGRVMQELVQGRHVMSLLFGSDVIRKPTPQLRDRAVALLLEHGAPAMRAGAVEVMEVSDPYINGMLRGLLTSAREARWGGDAIRRWLAKDEVSDHYDLARTARFFSWKGRGLTLAEAVMYFQTEENWAAGEANISDPGNSETLAHFLSTAPGHEADWRKVQDIHQQVQSVEWNRVPQTTRRSITAAVAWLALGPQPGTLIIQGRRIDAAGLGDLLNNSRHAGTCSLVMALMSAPGLALLKPLDSAAAEALWALAEVAHEVLRRAEENHWVEPDDQDSQTRVLRLALESKSVLRVQADQVRAAYATSTDPQVAGLLADPKSDRCGQLLLVLTSKEPQRFGLVTNAEYARQHLVGMDARCDQVCAAVFWNRLRRMLLTGGPCSGEWKSFFALGMILALLGLTVARDAVTTGVLLAGLAGWRGLLGWRIRYMARRLDPSARPWSWRDGPARCLPEMQRACPGAETPSLAELLQQLAAADAARAALLPATTPRRRSVPPRLFELWVGLATCVFWCVLCSAQLVKDYRRLVAVAEFSRVRPGSITVATPPLSPDPAQVKQPVDPLLNVSGLTPEMVAKIRRGEYEIVNQGFGDTLHGPIKPWNFLPPTSPAPLPLVAKGIATSAQRACAQVGGELLINPYGHKIINALVAVRVPVPKGVGLMLFSAHEHKLVDGEIILVRKQLVEGTWYQLGRRKIIYLGGPAEIEDEISLALK